MDNVTSLEGLSVVVGKQGVFWAVAAGLATRDIVLTATSSFHALYSTKNCSNYFFRKKKREAEIILSYRIKKISCYLEEEEKCGKGVVQGDWLV